MAKRSVAIVSGVQQVGVMPALPAGCVKKIQ